MLFCLDYHLRGNIKLRVKYICSAYLYSVLCIRHCTQVCTGPTAQVYRYRYSWTLQLNLPKATIIFHFRKKFSKYIYSTLFLQSNVNHHLYVGQGYLSMYIEQSPLVPGEMSDWEPGAYALTFYTSNTVVKVRRGLIDQQVRKAFENNPGSRYILSDRLNSKFLSGKKEHSGLFLCYVYNFVKAAGMLVCCDYCTRTCIVVIVVVVIKSANILNRILNISRSA